MDADSLGAHICAYTSLFFIKCDFYNNLHSFFLPFLIIDLMFFTNLFRFVCRLFSFPLISILLLMVFLNFWLAFLGTALLISRCFWDFLPYFDLHFIEMLNFCCLLLLST